MRTESLSPNETSVLGLVYWHTFSYSEEWDRQSEEDSWAFVEKSASIISGGNIGSTRRRSLLVQLIRSSVCIDDTAPLPS